MHPAPTPLGRWIARLANSVGLKRLRRALLARLPYLRLRSDVVDVVYLNWVLDARMLGELPRGIELFERDGKTVLTVLSYRHRHFGPALAGPLRRLFPSPLQSNWRFYISSVGGKPCDQATVLFFANAMDSPIFALGTRIFSDVMATHLPARFVHGRVGDSFRTDLQAGTGSAPDLHCELRLSSTRRLPPAFAALFVDWDEAIAWLCLQDRALAWVDAERCWAEATIRLPIDLATVTPLVAQRASAPMLDSWIDGTEPLCFWVPAVPFEVLSERLLPPDEPAFRA